MILVRLEMENAKIVHVDNENIFLEVAESIVSYSKVTALLVTCFAGTFGEYKEGQQMLGNRSKTLKIGKKGGKELW